jgi:hypothetical protein
MIIYLLIPGLVALIALLAVIMACQLFLVILTELGAAFNNGLSDSGDVLD